MTIERDFDRIARAWLDLGPNEAPDRSLAAVLQAIETTPQVRKPIRWPAWRPITMTRITMLAVLAGTIAILAGALLLSGGSPATPIPSTAPSAVPSATPGPLPTAIMGGWTAASRGTGIEDPVSTTILLGPSSVDTFATAFSIDRPGFSRMLGSNVVEETPGVLRFTLSNPGESNCDMRSVGTYRWALSDDAQWLTLDRIEDECSLRGEILAGTWQQNVGFSSAGGSGIAANFRPFVTMTLPAEPWRGNEYAEPETMVLDNSDGSASFKIWKDPDGFVDACDREAGRLDLEPGIDPFLAYLDGGEQFTVLGQKEYTIDGHRAVEVEIRLGDAIDGPCAPFDGNEDDRRGILLWASHAAQDAFWNGLSGDRWPLVVTEVDGATFLMEIVRQEGSAFPVDRSIIDSIRFHATPPEPPTS